MRMDWISAIFLSWNIKISLNKLELQMGISGFLARMDAKDLSEACLFWDHVSLYCTVRSILNYAYIFCSFGQSWVKVHFDTVSLILKSAAFFNFLEILKNFQMHKNLLKYFGARCLIWKVSS